MGKQPLTAAIRHFIITGHHIDIQNEQGVSGECLDQIPVLSSGLVQQIQQLLLFILIYRSRCILPEILRYLLCLHLRCMYHSAVHLIAGPRPSGTQKIGQLLLQSSIRCQYIDQLRRIDPALSLNKLLQTVFKALAAAVASPDIIRRGIQTVADMDQLDEKAVWGCRIIKLCRIAQLSVPRFVMTDDDIPVFPERRNIFDQLCPSPRMLADLAFFPFRQLARLLVHDLGNLDLANIKQLCSLGDIVQQFFSAL